MGMTYSQHGTNAPETLALLDFEPVPRRFKKESGWTAAMQRLFIAKLAVHGSPGKACDELGMYRSGIDKVFKSKGAEGFRAAWAAAVELADRRRTERVAAGHADVASLQMPFLDNRRKGPATAAADATPRAPIPVVCDKCACDGFAGDDKFAGIPDILAFEPVRMPFGDKGWDEARQRAFIAALAVTGSTARAARSVGRHELGAERLRKMRGARGFSEAWDAALEIARDRELMRLGGTLEGLSSGSVEAASYDEDGQYSARLNDEAREQLVNKLLRLKRRKEGEDASRGVNPT